MHRVLKGIFLEALLLVWFFMLALMVRADDIQDLGSDKYKTRQDAQNTLKKRMNFKLYVELRVLDPPSLEVGQRIAKLLKEFEEKYLATQKFEVTIEYPELPWICLTENYDYSCPYLALAPKETRNGSPKWTDWRVATNLWLTDELSREALDCLRTCKDEKDFKGLMKLRIASTIVILNQMIAREDRWWSDQKQDNPLRKERKPDL